jgi:uncharacterized protein YjeT (DUF2065 family)
MTSWALLAPGLVLVVEGLLWVLAPGLVENLLAALRALTLEERRLAGFAALALGLALVWGARIVGGLPP